MNSPAAVVYDNLSGFARECLSIADEAMAKLAATNLELEAVKAKKPEIVLTKVAADEIPLARVAATVDRMVKTDFVKRSNRSATIDGIRNASREQLFEILEKFASIAICPVSALNRDDDGEVVEKAAGKTTDASEEEDVWSRALREARDEVGA